MHLSQSRTGCYVFFSLTNEISIHFPFTDLCVICIFQSYQKSKILLLQKLFFKPITFWDFEFQKRWFFLGFHLNKNHVFSIPLPTLTSRLSTLLNFWPNCLSWILSGHSSCKTISCTTYFLRIFENLSQSNSWLVGWSLVWSRLIFFLFTFIQLAVIDWNLLKFISLICILFSAFSKE